MSASGRARVALCALLLVAGTVAIWWPLSAMWWSGEDLVGLHGSRGESWLRTLTTPPPGFPYFRPLWSGHIKLWDAMGWSPESAHLSVLALHALGLLVLFLLAARSGVPVVAAGLGCLLAGSLPGTVDAVAWFAAGNKAWSFLFAAALVALCCARVGLTALVLGALAIQTLAVACSENSHGNVLLVPGLLLIARWCHRMPWSRVAAALAATAVPSALQLLLLWLRHAKFSHTPDLQFPGLTMGRYLAHGFDLPGSWWWVPASLVAASLVAGMWRRDALLAGSALAVFLINLPSGLFWGGRHHASLPVLAGGIWLAVVLLRVCGARLCAVPLLVLLVALVPVTRERLEIYRRHFDHLRAVADGLRAPELRDDVGVVNLPLEFVPVFSWLWGDGAMARVRLWNQVTTRASRGAPLCVPEQPVPQAARWFEYDGAGLVPLAGEVLTDRPAAPPVWLAVPRAGPRAGREPLVTEVFASPLPLDQLNLVAAEDAPRVPVATSAAGSARLLAHRLVLAPAPAFEWEVEAEVVPGGPPLLVLTWTPGAFPVSEWIVHDSFPERLPAGPLRVEIQDLDSGQPVRAPVVFVNAYFPGLVLPAGKHRLRVRGAL